MSSRPPAPQNPSPTDRDRRWAAYTAAAGLTLAGGAVPDAQAVPTPCDLTLPHPVPMGTMTDDIDLDGDTVDDFGVASSNSVKVPRGKSKNKFRFAFGGKLAGNSVITVSSGSPFLKPLEEPATVGSVPPDSGAFTSGGIFFAGAPLDNAPIQLNFGFRFLISAATHYGWMRIEVTDPDVVRGDQPPEISIIECAYEDVADTPIDVGSVPVELQSFEID